MGTIQADSRAGMTERKARAKTSEEADSLAGMTERKAKAKASEEADSPAGMTEGKAWAKTGRFAGASVIPGSLRVSRFLFVCYGFVGYGEQGLEVRGFWFFVHDGSLYAEESGFVEESFELVFAEAQPLVRVHFARFFETV